MKEGNVLLQLGVGVEAVVAVAGDVAVGVGSQEPMVQPMSMQEQEKCKKSLPIAHVVNHEKLAPVLKPRMLLLVKKVNVHLGEEENAVGEGEGVEEGDVEVQEEVNPMGHRKWKHSLNKLNAKLERLCAFTS
jgi:hypothetical protein